MKLTDGYAVLGAEELDVTIDGAAVWVGFGRTRGALADLEEDAGLNGKVAVVAIKGPRGRVRDELSVEQKFGMSFGVLGGLGRTARRLAKVGAQAVVFVQHDDRIGLSDVLNYVAVSPGKANVAPDFSGADRGMAMTRSSGMWYTCPLPSSLSSSASITS